jgi:hypothetical protein
MNKNILWTILLWALLICTAQPSYGSILIGRMTHVEGNVLTYSEDEEDWVEAGSNTPVGAEDGFYADKDAKAELVFPNDTMLRIGEATEVEVLRIDEEATEVYIRTGIVRAYSRGLDAVMKVGTAMGYVEIPPQGIADFFVDDQSTEVVPLQEDILFHKTVGAGAPETHRLRAGSNSLIFSVRHVETGTALTDTPWNRWCLDRDMILEEQAAIRSAHLPSSLQVYSHELEPYGEWERMKYRGYTYWFWRPVHVSVGWTPFTMGWWNRWHQEYVWISTEPWGWCTHHYGNWVNVYGAWWWTPYIHMGVSFPGISLVNFNIHFGPLFKPFWHPGRIAWVSTASHVGWIPLAPWETYYGCRKWGPRTVVVKYRDTPKNKIDINHYAYRKHSVIIPQKEFRRASPNRQHDYRKLMVTGVKRNTILRDAKPTYGHHQMAKVAQNVRKARKNDIVKKERTITKPNRLRSSNPPVRVSRDRAQLKPAQKTTLPPKELGDRTAKVTKRPPLASSNPKSGAKESPQVSSTAPPRAQSMNKNTVPLRSGPSEVNQPSKNSKKWASLPSRQNRGATDRHTTPVKTSRDRAQLKPSQKTPLPPKELGDRTAKVTKRPPLASSNPRSGAKESPQVSTAPPPRKPSMKQAYSALRNLTQTRPKQSESQTTTPPRAQSMNKNTVPSRSGPSEVNQPSKNPKKWASPQSRENRGAKERNTALKRKRN